MKVIFLAFANSASTPLEFLTEEDKEIYDVSSERYAYGDYFLHRESFATPETINKFLDRYKDDLAVFHYAGHAGKDKLLVNDQNIYSSGIAKQLKHCAEKGSLKLVILNGCSTAGQVKVLKENGIPAIVSTSAPINDKSALEFSKRLWQKLVKEEMTTEDAYSDALGAAMTVTSQDLGNAGHRHLFTEENEPPGDSPLWRLDCINDEAIKISPMPHKDTGTYPPPPPPNVELIETLYKSFKEADNHQIVELWEKEEKGLEVSDSTKQIAIVNSIPFPIGVHLQRLICPTLGSEDEAYDEYGIKRLEQIAQLFQITTEFLGVIMIAQVWEIFVQNDSITDLDKGLKNKLKEYLELNEKDREVYDYIPLIQMVREYLEKLQTNNIINASFIDEQELLSKLFLTDDDFRSACNYLSNLRSRVMKNRIDKDRAKIICIEAEKQLCIFIKSLGFIHRYQLTSVQNIDILKFRHILKNKTEYKHRIIKCMQAIGTDESSYYYMDTFLDNWGVILLKCKTSRINLKGRTKRFKVEVEGYLNLSPFVIDRNSFMDKTDLAYIMFFKSESDKEISYKRVKNPLSQRDAFAVKKQDEEDDNFEPIRVQYNAFKKFIA